MANDPQVVVVKLSKEGSKYLKDLQKILTPGELASILTPFFERKGAICAGRISQQMLSGQRLKRRTGNLARSVVGRAETYRGGLPAMRVGVLRGPALAYAAAQERGATIVPKNAKALAIPVGDALTPAGVERFGGPRGYPGTLKFIPFRRSGVAVGGLFDASSIHELPDGKIDFDKAKLLYVLARKVVIPAKHYIHDGFYAFLPELIRDLEKLFAAILLGTTKEELQS